MVNAGHGTGAGGFLVREGLSTFLEKGGQREVQTQTRQRAGMPVPVPGSRKSKRSKVKNLSGIVRLANE